VHFLYYQKDKSDQFIHRYEYDGDNRVTEVYTSRDGIVWDNDANYDYYAHGPIARTHIPRNYIKKLHELSCSFCFFDRMAIF